MRATLALLFAASLLIPASAQIPRSQTKMQAKGDFDVKLIPQTDGPTIGRMLLEKKFHADLEATSQGQMLATQTTFKGSAGYVAIEQVKGTLAGKTGTFLLQHSGIMDRGKPSLTVLILPDSGTEELAGISGSMKIIIEGGKHSYALDYELP